jgi:short-subunit dehydrogenase
MGEFWVGRRVLVTGASSGIGAALARELANAGATVGLCARRTALLDEVLADCQRSVPACRAWTVDLADLDGIDGFAERAEHELGGVDVLVNNAGLSRGGDATTMAWADVEYLTRLDYLSPVRLTRALLPAMRARGTGNVAVVSSMAARVSTPGEAAYAAAKAALSAYFEALAGELWGGGIGFHLVYPGLIDLSGEDGDDALADTAQGGLRVPSPVLARAMMRQVETGALELYMPHVVQRFVANRALDVAASIQSMSELYRSGALP